MSYRAAKGEAQQRKPGRSGNPAAPAPSSNRSFKKPGNGHDSVTPANSAASANRTVQNGVHPPAPSHGVGSSKVPPKAPSPQLPAGASGPLAPKTPSKGDASRAFTLQFGSISPGVMNGLQIPSRTSSAPPNLDEQKRDQDRHGAYKAMPSQPVPDAQKQQRQQTKKDASVANSQVGKSLPNTQIKREVHVPVPSHQTVVPQRSSVLPIGGIPIPMSLQQPQTPLQFGAPGMQMQSQGVPANFIPMTLPISAGNPTQVPRQMFIPSMHSQVLRAQTPPQGQGLGFAPQMGHQLSPHSGNIAIGTPPQFPQQQYIQFGGPRKSTVKITHPETHEELRLDKKSDSYTENGSSGQRSLPNVIPQSQPVPTFTPSHQMNYYTSLRPNSYNGTPVLFPNTSLPLTSTQVSTGSLAQLYSYPLSQGGQPISFMNQDVLNPMPNSKPASSPLSHSLADTSNFEGLPISGTPAPVQVSVKPPASSYSKKVGMPLVTISSPIDKAEPVVAVSDPVSKAVTSAPISTSFVEARSSVIVNKRTSRSEPFVTTTASIIKAELSVPIATNITKADTPVLSKPSGDITSSQVNAELAPVSSIRQLKPVPEPSDDNLALSSERHSRGLPTVRLPQRTQLVISTSAPVAIGDTGPTEAGTDGRKSEALQRSESLKEHNKKPSKDDARQSHEQYQIEASNPPESMPVKANSVEDTRNHQVSDGSEDIQSPPETDSSICASSLPSSIVGQSISSEVGASGLIKAQTLNAGSGSSGVRTDKERSKHVPPVSLAYNLGDADASAKQGGQSQPSVPFCSEEDGAIPRTSAQDGDLLVEVRHEQEIVVVAHQNSEPSSSSLDACQVSPVSTLTKSLKKEKDAVQNSETIITLNGTEKKNHETCNREMGSTEALHATTTSELIHTESVCSNDFTSQNVVHSDSLAHKYRVICNQDDASKDPEISSKESVNLPTSVSSEITRESKATELSNGDPISVVNNKLSMKTTKVKTTGGKRKKRKDMLSKADAAGSSDLYNAYKGGEEKQEISTVSESTENSLPVGIKNVSSDVSDKDAVVGQEDESSKTDLDDWEDAADVSTPKLETSEDVQQVRVKKHQDEFDDGAMGKKKYSRDFLLTLAEQCNDIPTGFNIASDIMKALMSVKRDPYPSSGKISDRPSGGSRGDRPNVAMREDGKWTKQHGSFGPGGDFRGDVRNGVPTMDFRSSQGANHDFLRNSRGHPVGGILSGPVQSSASQAGNPRNNIEADRWQRARGLISSPQTPYQVIHKAEKKYEVGKVSDEEQIKQRRLKAILNKLTPQNFDKLFAQVTEVNIDNVVTLTGVISQIFDKALMEPTFCEMYANFCFHLAGTLPDFIVDDQKITFKRLLLNKCQEEFEKGENEQAEANKVEEEGDVKLSEAEREEKRLRARRRMLGNIRLIGELYKKKMLTEKIMHSCINKLLGQLQTPDEEDIEALCKLMSTIGEMIDHAKAKVHIDAYYEIMQKLSNNQNLSSRVRFMLKDAIDLRRNKWQQRRKVDGPKTIEEVHRVAAQERQAQASRSVRAPSRRGQPVDYGTRGSTALGTPYSQQVGSVRNLPHQARGHAQDIRLADRHQHDNRSMPLPQRPANNDPITLGPQGGLAKGMSIRGQPLISTIPSSETHPSVIDPRRIPSPPNGYTSTQDQIPYSFKEEMTPRSTLDRSSSGRVFERSSSTLSHRRSISGSQNIPSEAKTLSEEDLRQKSLYAIREFYSAKDDNELVLCVKELNAPDYSPSMVSLWVADSFERKDIERDLLAGLLVSLRKRHGTLLSHIQLIQGFESVLSSLEDAVNDAPKAGEFLGRIFAKVIVEDVVSLGEIGKLIHEGGEEPGRLLEKGLASEVLGSILESIRNEKGDPVLTDIRNRSNLRLEHFRPPHPLKSKKLDLFL